MAFTFGSGGGFGQQNQQSSTPAFGGFGTNNAGTTFGSSAPAFGQQAQQPQQTSLFGSAGGGFGSTQTNSAPAFGSSNTNTGGGLFGSQPATTGAFGGGSGFSFGQPSQPAAGGGLFGNTNTGFGSGLGGNNTNPNDPVNPNPHCPVPTNGSADAPPNPKDASKILMWKDNRTGTQTGADGKQTSITGEQLLFDSIVALPMYWHTSPEELRVQDYQQNRKTAPAAPATTFGGFGTSSGTGGFGTSQNTAPAFGQSNTGGGLFGSNTANNVGGGLFGGSSAFGKPANTPAFGQANTGASGGLFGQPAASTSTNTGFGQSNAGTSTFGGFGQNTQNKPTFSFGGANTASQPSTGLFGQQNTTNTGFGQANQTQAPAPAFGGFGQTNNNTNSGGLFGNTANKPTGGLFGNTTTSTDNKPAFSFGQTNTASQPSTGLFGQQNNQQQQQPAQTGGLFGNLGGGSGFGQNSNTSTSGGLFGNSAAKPATGGLFGNTNPTTSGPTLNFGAGATNTNAGSSLFGGNSGGTSLFGNNQQQQPAQQQTQATGGLFGSGGGGSMFGNSFGQNQNQNTQPATGFGLTQPSSTFSGFGQSLGQSSNLQQMSTQTLPQLNTSIDQNPYGNNPIFANIQPVQAQALPADAGKKQPALTISYRGAPRSTPKIAKLRGFASSVSSPSLAESRFGSPSIASASPLAASAISRSITSSPALALLNGAGNGGNALPPEAFVQRPSVKKLVIDQKSRENMDFLARRRNDAATPTRSLPQPDENGAERERLSYSQQQNDPAERLLEPSSQLNGNKGKAVAMSAQSSSQGASNSRKGQMAAERAPADGDYYSKPDLVTLKRASNGDRAEIHDFVIGRHGYGEISWLEPVDLTALRSLDELLGAVVIIEDREVMVYPGEYEDDKPDVGQGLNVPAAISLKNCWPLDKSTRNPIKDGNNTRVQQHIKKLRKKQETEFVDYEVETGTWTFKVQHFSRYGLDESDEEDDTTAVVEHVKGRADSSPADNHKRSTQARASRIAKRTRTAESPVSDTTTDADGQDQAPPQATLEDDEMESVEDDADIFAPLADSTFDSQDEHGPQTDESETDRRRRRSVAVPTPRFAPRSQFRDLGSPGHGVADPARSSRQMSTFSEGEEVSLANQQNPFAQRLRLEPKKLAVMQASFFATGTTPGKAQSPAAPIQRQAFSSLADAPFRSHAQQSIPADAGYARSDLVEQEHVPSYRKLRTWQSSPLASSLSRTEADVPVDAGATFGRSFGLSWGPQGQLLHNGGVARFGNQASQLTASTVSIENMELAKDVQDSATLLNVQLEYSNISSEDEEHPPLAEPAESLRFRDFIPAYQQRDGSDEALLWQLGRALFDEIDLALPETASRAIRKRIEAEQRRKALSSWLQAATATQVDSAVRQATPGDAAAAAEIFALLTGYRLSEACQTALKSGNVRLATILSQVGSDMEFQSHINEQLRQWRDTRVDAQIPTEIRKIYEVLSGNVGLSPGRSGNGVADCSSDIDICADLDWLRALAIRFWYEDPNGGLEPALASYDRATSEAAAAAALPAYAVARSEEQTDPLHDSQPIADARYNLLKLAIDGSVPIESVLLPRTFGASAVDLRLPWHLSMLMTRAMRIRGFSDANMQGHSHAREEITAGYADQLEKEGRWEWAIFVLMHLSRPESRTKAIRDVLARQLAHGHLSDDKLRFVRDRLQVRAEHLAAARQIAGLDEADEAGMEQTQ